MANYALSIGASDNQSTNDVTQVEERLHMNSPGVKPTEQHEPGEITPILTQANAVPKENEMKSRPLQHHDPKATPEVQVLFLIKVDCKFLFTSISGILAFRIPWVMI